MPSPADTQIVRARVLPVLFLSAVLAGCAARPTTPAPRPPEETLRVETLERGVKEIRDVRLEDYVAASALSEFAPSAGDPAAVEAMFEVQSIIARTYALSHLGRHAAAGFDLCSTTHCQLYEPQRLQTSRWASLAIDAAARTRGLVVAYDGAIADAVFHADCGGRTSTASDVWGGAGAPYLRGQLDDGDAASAHAGWQYAVDTPALIRALDGDPRTAIGRRLGSIIVVSRDASGRAQRILLHGDRDVAIRGADLREVMSAAFGARSIRSTLFDVVPGDAGRFLFSGSGFGHGVGLCQAGAYARVAKGVSPATVLQRYYPGTAIVRADSLRTSSRTPRG
jgi:stage II sporulation protein D